MKNIEITKDHFRDLEKKLNIGSIKFEIIGEPNKNQHEMFNEISNWVQDNKTKKYTSRLSVFDNKIFINFFDKDVFFDCKANIKKDIKLKSKEKYNIILNALKENFELITNNIIFEELFNELKKDGECFFNGYIFKFDEKIYYDIMQKDILINCFLAIRHYDTNKLIKLNTSENIVDSLNTINNIFREEFYKKIVNKKFSELSIDEKNLIKLFYYE